MVEYSLQLDNIFSSLSDPIRRDILKRVAIEALSVSDIAQSYNMTLAAISKHLKVLEKAKLIIKHKKGKQHFIELEPNTLLDAAEQISYYEKLWNQRFDALDKILQEEKMKLKS